MSFKEAKVGPMYPVKGGMEDKVGDLGTCCKAPLGIENKCKDVMCQTTPPWNSGTLDAKKAEDNLKKDVANDAVVSFFAAVFQCCIKPSCRYADRICERNPTGGMKDNFEQLVFVRHSSMFGAPDSDEKQIVKQCCQESTKKKYTPPP